MGHADLAVRGTAFHAPTPDRLDVLEDVVIAVDADGRIDAIHPGGSPEGDITENTAAHSIRLASGQRLLPGLIDLHLHAPQWPQLGTGLDLPLERWLFEHTFPLEARFADASFAAEVWSHMVPTLLAHGTTTAVFFSSIHEEATLALAQTCVQAGQRAFVGRVAMDHPEGTPESYRDRSPAEGIDASAASIEAIRGLGSRIVQPMLTPRFIPACSDELLEGLGELAESTGTLVQTHCSESDWEHDAVIERFGHTDTAMLDRFGLLRRSTVLAHGDHLTDEDFRRVATVGAGVAHCPLSNSYFANAVFPVRRALEAGVGVGLGTDVAGGGHPGLLPQAAHAVTVSRMLEDGVDRDRSSDARGVPESRIDVVTAFHLATAGGADVLGLPVGRFAPGQQFDAFVVDIDAAASGLRRWDVDSEERLFEKLVRLAGPDAITRVWVDGKEV
ncbi:MAG: guanine deaminase [Acidimicrobiia bacterium]|nr:guanine deaminase [Acidimicrobiia bacterium]